MKKIPLWKIIALSIVTLGVYTIVWFALRRNDFVRKYDQHLPHWLWLILPAAAGAILWVVSLITIYALIPGDPGRQYDLMIVATYGFLVLIPFGISLWWIDRFGQAVQLATGSRIPVLWTMLIYFFLGPTVIIVHQYYFNHIDSKTPLDTTPVVGPSQRFTLIASVVVAVAALLSISSWISFPEEYRQSRDDFLNSIKQQN